LAFFPSRFLMARNLAVAHSFSTTTTATRKSKKRAMVLHVDLSAERGPVVAATNGVADDDGPSTSGSNGALQQQQQQQRKYRGVDRSRPIAAGDVVIIYERHDRTRALVVTPGEKFNNQFGAFHHDVRQGGRDGTGRRRKTREERSEEEKAREPSRRKKKRKRTKNLSTSRP